MSLAFNCGATRPTAERYADPRFRRLHRWFDPHKVGEAECRELAAFLHVVPVKWARRIFHWTDRGVKAAEYVLANHSDEAMIEANLRTWSVEDAVGVVRALKDAGWTRGKLPKMVQMAFYDLRDRGFSAAQIAERFDLGVWQVEWVFRSKVRAAARNRAALGLLAV